MSAPNVPLFPRGVFTISLDFELVWGSRDLVRGDMTRLLAEARVTRTKVFDALLGLLVAHGIVATWATVGHLFLGEAARVGGVLHPEVVVPRHAWHPTSWFEGIPAGTEAEHPEYYGRSLLLRLRDAGQDIGSHSFSHPIFGDAGCSREAADTDLARCVSAAEALGIRLRAFVFPRNRPGHVDLLARHGFTCWRSVEPVWYQRTGVPRAVGRLVHLGEVAMASRPPVVVPFRDAHGLWCIPASGSFLPTAGVRRLIPLRQRVARAVRGIDAAVATHRLSHLWLHPINLAAEPDRLVGAIRQIIEHAARQRDAGRLEILSMTAVAERAAAATTAEGGVKSQDEAAQSGRS